MICFTETTALYWSEIKKKLLQYIKKYKISSKNEEIELQKIVTDFCEQGTGYQNTLYKFISEQLLIYIQENLKEIYIDKGKYNLLVSKLSFICINLDIHYLKKHPKHKKKIKSINDLSNLYYREYICYN